jgi:class 3 adenylate cyclase
MVRFRHVLAHRFGRSAPSYTATRTTTSTRSFATVAEPPRTEKAELPSGTVTFLFTDMEGSKRLLARLGGGYAEVLGEHRRVLRAAFDAYDGSRGSHQG